MPNYKTLLSVAFLGALTINHPVWGQPNYCTQDTVTGTYALTFEGTVLVTSASMMQPASLPGAGLSLVSIDSKGNIDAPGYMIVGNNMALYPAMPGTLQVHSHCTGVVNWVGGGAANATILDEGGIINTQMFDCGAMGQCVVYGTWTRISRVPNTVAPAQCSPASVSGTYSFRQKGYLMQAQAGVLYPGAVPFASLGIASIGYDASVTGSGTTTTAGQSRSFAMDQGKLEMKADCTGTITFQVISGGQEIGQAKIWLVTLHGGQQILTIETQDPAGKPVVSGTMTRLSPIPTVAQ